MVKVIPTISFGALVITTLRGFVTFAPVCSICFIQKLWQPLYSFILINIEKMLLGDRQVGRKARRQLGRIPCSQAEPGSQVARHAP